ncbi:MAG: hypothetical protein NVV79_09195 [Devosia ginsengisoli]|nr:hypothetical protein [Devosia ginsengisoli]MCR6671511.1 hypothetical protein [Devosia ginsengisoli]
MMRIDRIVAGRLLHDRGELALVVGHPPPHFARQRQADQGHDPIGLDLEQPPDDHPDTEFAAAPAATSNRV